MTYRVQVDDHLAAIYKPVDPATGIYGSAAVAAFGIDGLFIKTTDDWRPLPDRNGKPSPSDWEMFKLEVSRLFGVDLPEDYQPKWLTEE